MQYILSMHFLFSSAKMEQGNLTFQVFYVAVNNPRLDKPNWRLASSTLSMQCSGSPKSKQGKLVTSFFMDVSLSWGFAFLPYIYTSYMLS